MLQTPRLALPRWHQHQRQREAKKILDSDAGSEKKKEKEKQDVVADKFSFKKKKFFFFLSLSLSLSLSVVSIIYGLHNYVELPLPPPPLLLLLSNAPICRQEDVELLQGVSRWFWKGTRKSLKFFFNFQLVANWYFPPEPPCRFPTFLCFLGATFSTSSFPPPPSLKGGHFGKKKFLWLQSRRQGTKKKFSFFCKKKVG